MVEQKVKKRGWVKNAVIIFLAVMLVLTFFSNTIMNRSLPEVATQYSQSGTITAKIRGTGTITANENYEVKLDQTREVLSVNVRTGDAVEVGDPLFVLKDTESTELDTAQGELDDLELNYQKAIINATDADFAKENRDIQLARTDLEEATAERDAIKYSDETITTLKHNITVQKNDIIVKEAAVKTAQANLDALGGLDQGSDGGDYSVVTAAKTALDNAKSNLQAIELAYNDKYQQLKDRAYSNMETVYVPLLSYSGTKTYGQHLDDLIAEGDQSKIDAFKATIKSKAESEWKNNSDIYIAAEAEKLASDEPMRIAYDAIKSAKDAVDTAQAAYNSALSNYNSGSSGNAAQYNKLKAKVTEAESALETAKTKLEQYEEALTEEEQKKTDWKAANEAVKTAQKALEDLIFGLSETQKTTGKTQATEALELAALRKNVEDKRTEVEKLRGGSTDSTILANVAGVIKSVGVSAGNTTTPDTALMVIEVADRGYYVSFSVSTEQSKRVKIGDSADVTTSFWGTSMSAVLSGIKTDPDNPGTNKLLVFNISGDEVESGSQVSITLAQQSASYDMTVPNSAIRQDSNGTFVLIVEAKSSPLGTRYIAKRVDVQVLATDDTNSAISGGLSQWGDSVITTSTKPIEPGQQVRIADN